MFLSRIALDRRSPHSIEHSGVSEVDSKINREIRECLVTWSKALNQFLIANKSSIICALSYFFFIIMPYNGIQVSSGKSTLILTFTRPGNRTKSPWGWDVMEPATGIEVTGQKKLVPINLLNIETLFWMPSLHIRGIDSRSLLIINKY